jgi:uncharacterized protein (TIGR02757 family)
MSKSFLKLISRFQDPKWIESDPILFPHRFQVKEDQELVGLISALFSYGNVKAIQTHLNSLLNLFGDSPFKNFLEFDFKKSKHLMNKYRFQTKDDISQFLIRIQEIYRKDRSIELYFVSDNLQDGILNFQNYFFQNISSRTNGLNFLIGRENPQSGYKRWRMFLRWMVRDQFPDFGIWKQIRTDHLEYPIDTHIQKISKILGIRKRNTTDYKLSLEITEYFKHIFPNDPLIMDFPLTRLGIMKICKMKKIESICSNCELKSFCKIYQEEVM